MAGLTLAKLMETVSHFTEEELLQPIEILAMLDDVDSEDPLLKAELERYRSTYLFVTTASNDPVVFYAEPMTDQDYSGYLTYGTLKVLGDRLNWQANHNPISIESELTSQRFRLSLNPVGMHDKVIIAKGDQSPAVHISH